MTGESDAIVKKVPKTFNEGDKINPFLISGSKINEVIKKKKLNFFLIIKIIIKKNLCINFFNN